MKRALPKGDAAVGMLIVMAVFMAGMWSYGMRHGRAPGHHVTALPTACIE